MELLAHVKDCGGQGMMQLAQVFCEGGFDEVERLMEGVGKFGPEMVQQLTQVLGDVSPEAMEQLTKVLSHVRPEVMEQLVHGLCQLGPGAIEHFTQGLLHERPQVVLQSIRAAGHVRLEVLDQLTHVTHHVQPEVMQEFAEVLSHVGLENTELLVKGLQCFGQPGVEVLGLVGEGIQHWNHFRWYVHHFHKFGYGYLALSACVAIILVRTISACMFFNFHRWTVYLLMWFAKGLLWAVEFVAIRWATLGLLAMVTPWGLGKHGDFPADMRTEYKSKPWWTRCACCVCILGKLFAKPTKFFLFDVVNYISQAFLILETETSQTQKYSEVLAGMVMFTTGLEFIYNVTEVAGHYVLGIIAFGLVAIGPTLICSADEEYFRLWQRAFIVLSVLVTFFSL